MKPGIHNVLCIPLCYTYQSETRDPPEGGSREEVALKHAKEVLGSGDETLASDGGGDGAKVRELLNQLQQALHECREMQQGGLSCWQ